MLKVNLKNGQYSIFPFFLSFKYINLSILCDTKVIRFTHFDVIFPISQQFHYIKLEKL